MNNQRDDDQYKEPSIEDVSKEVSREVSIGDGYPRFQIAKALTTVQQHPDAKTRERAEKKISQWVAVLNGMADGSLSVGDRTPVSNTPAWVTPKVITGGFATGQRLAGGDLREHERHLLQAIAPEALEATLADQRQLFNRYYISEAGLAQLQDWLQTGAYQIEVPEEGALLVVAWLLEAGETKQARSLLETLAPWFNQLRFYPAVRSQPHQSSAQVHLHTVKDVSTKLANIAPNQRILAQKESIEVWIPLYDQLVSLFLETVEGDVPTLQTNNDGQWVRSPEGRFPVIGGWPCQQYPDDWETRAKALLYEFSQHQKQHHYCLKPTRKKESLAQLHDYLQRCVDNGTHPLSGREVGRIRMLLARYINKRGLPESERCRQLRQQQSQQIAAPTFKEISRVVISRLSNCPADQGLSCPEDFLTPVQAKESTRWNIPTETTIPASLQTKVQKSLHAPIEDLVEKGLITSGEVLAQMLPQITADIEAVGIADLSLRRLYAVIYRAFRQRRSLLLLDLQKQVQIEELPWISAIAQHKGQSVSARAIATDTLTDIATLALTAFPQTILPNKLLQEMVALAKTAKLGIPLTEELAVDIFMGKFSEKFDQAALIAADLLTDSLYERYYAIDYRQIRTLLTAKKQSFISHLFRGDKKASQKKSRRTIDAAVFAELCRTRAGVPTNRYSPAANGMIIEQQQIVTTHNLAALCSLPKIAERLTNTASELSQHCFIWLTQRLQIRANDWHTGLIQIKQSAYAWRQMLFFLSLLPDRDVQAFVAWMTHYLSTQPDSFQHRFRPATAGLINAVYEQPSNSASHQPAEAQRFLGWSTRRHWLISE
ncbi:MAG: hypothetical protein AAFQ63_05115 [Cyanobacteria bacterium J06621_11]